MTRTLHHAAAAFIVGCFAFAAAPASATPIFSNLNATAPYYPNDYLFINSGRSLAMPFKSSGDFALTQIDLGLRFLTGTNNGALISLYTDVAGNPGTLLGSWTLATLPTSHNKLATIAGITGIDLTAGTKYFLGAASIGSTSDEWGLAIPLDDHGGRAFQSGSWGPVAGLGAFDIIGSAHVTPVPEPPALALFLTGLVVFGAMALRRKRGATA
ncbi:MAG: choice-of-anchor R domain-containing protein [Rhizomicrobium sp.]